MSASYRLLVRWSLANDIPSCQRLCTGCLRALVLVRPACVSRTPDPIAVLQTAPGYGIAGGNGTIVHAIWSSQAIALANHLSPQNPAASQTCDTSRFLLRLEWKLVTSGRRVMPSNMAVIFRWTRLTCSCTPACGGRRDARKSKTGWTALLSNMMIGSGLRTRQTTFRRSCRHTSTICTARQLQCMGQYA